MTKLPLITEGVWSDDGSRFVTVGSTTWREPPLPITNSNGDLIGKVSRIWREDDTVMCEYETFADIKSITVFAGKGEYSISDEHGGMTIEHPCIYGGCGHSTNEYIWRNSGN